MDLGLKNKRVAVTGSSKGIGFAIAKSFASEGAQVILNGRDENTLESAAAQIQLQTGHKPRYIVANLANAEGVRHFISEVGELDVLVNNAGAIPSGDIQAVDADRWSDAWDLKVFGYINITRAILPKMQQRKQGVILNIIGIAGRAPRADYICGSTGNAALIAFTQALGGAAPEHGVRIYGINPSPTQSDRIQTIMRAQAQRQFGDEDRWFELTHKLAFGRLAKPEEVADLAVFTASDRCGYLSGTVIDVDGGMTVRDTKSSH